MKLVQLNKRSVNGRFGPSDALTQVLEVTGGKIEDLNRKEKGPRRNSVRMLAAWWMSVGTGLPNTEVARILDMSTAGVCRARRCVRSEHVRKPGSKLVKWATKLEENSRYSAKSVEIQNHPN